MNKRTFFTLALTIVLCCFRPAMSQDTSTAAAELKTLVAKVQEKLRQGKKTEGELSPELKEFDNLIEKHKGEKTDDTAQIILMKAMLYVQVLDNTDQGVQLIQQIKQDYPDTKAGKNADTILDSIKQQDAGRKVQRTLVEGAKFPDFNEKDLAGNPLSVANYSGKIVLVDFWATWCAPCVGEMPSVIKAYENNHDKGFEIIGISLDQDEARLKNFIKEKNMPWPQYFDGKMWGNKLAQQYGIQSIPNSYLLDREGRIIAHDLRGPELDQMIQKVLAPKN